MEREMISYNDELEEVEIIDPKKMGVNDPFEKEAKKLLKEEESECFKQLYIGIDPGWSNFGIASCFAEVDPANKKIKFHAEVRCFELFAPGTQMTTHNLLVPLSSCFYRYFPRDEDVCKAFVLQESQYFNPRGANVAVSHNLCRMNDILHTFVETKYNTVMHTVKPADIKRFFKTSKGEHAKNKKAALEAVENFVPAIKGKINDHHADAWLLIYYKALLNYPGYHFDLKISVLPKENK